jgi:hypothetical protein
MDLDAPRPMNIIHGVKPFRVAGFNMVMDDEGAEVYLQNPLGVTFPVTVDEVASTQLFTAHVAAAVEPGDYRLVVKSRGGDPEGVLQTTFRKVKCLAAETPKPEITRVFCEGHEGDTDKLFDDAKVTIEGSGLAAASGIKFVFQDKMAGEHEFEVGEHIEIAKSDTKLFINDTTIVETMRTICTDSETELNTSSGAAVKVTLTDGTELYHAVAFG